MVVNPRRQRNFAYRKRTFEPQSKGEKNIYHIDVEMFNNKLAPYLVAKKELTGSSDTDIYNELLYYDKEQNFILGVAPSKDKPGKLEIVLSPNCKKEIREKIKFLTTENKKIPYGIFMDD
ncbi:hypothetical protein K9L16_03650 [Candidatus Pacearchaeota archaeon]|nr:hypothetical protein [Candidatus Pacearchaeota archaeon]